MSPRHHLADCGLRSATTGMGPHWCFHRTMPGALHCSFGRSRALGGRDTVVVVDLFAPPRVRHVGRIVRIKAGSLFQPSFGDVHGVGVVARVVFQHFPRQSKELTPGPTTLPYFNTA